MPTACRPASREDLDQADALVVASINDLTQRHGFGAMASRSAPRFQAFCLSDDPRGLWTAEQNGEPVGFAWSWACEDFWFLAQLFVTPGLQSSGIGRMLLQRTLEHADARGATQRALITFSFNTVSQGLYIRYGFLPRFPVYLMSLPRELTSAQAVNQRLESQPLDGSEKVVASLSELDRQALGFSRGEHHRLLSCEPGIQVFGLYDAGRLVGYFYISAGGHIGPLTVASPDLIAPALSAGLAQAIEGSSENVSCFVPGLSAGALRCALDHGLHIRFPMLMMSTADLGSWPCYLPRNPGFM